jgi:hypothetical protein
VSEFTSLIGPENCFGQVLFGYRLIDGRSMVGAEDRKTDRLFEIVPGNSIGPFRLRMTRAEISTICEQNSVPSDLSILKGGMSFDFDERERVVRIEVAAEFKMGRLTIRGKKTDVPFQRRYPKPACDHHQAAGRLD